jgi:phosphopantothenoylcysteine decarboxylase/phosphopantothenate--cysteine ligase
MYEHPATQANLNVLRDRGLHVIEPGTGPLASRGEWGVGRLAEPVAILEAIEMVAGGAPRPLDGMRVLVTAGGTREPLDAVRFVGNRSSGRMGFALAAEAARRGAAVTVIAANTALDATPGVRYVTVQTADQLRDATLSHLPDADLLLMAAAVADFKPEHPQDAKISRDDRDSLSVNLIPTTDVLAEASARRRAGQLIVGFAAEHGPQGIERARAKLERKALDAIVVNDISRPDIGFDSDHNEVAILGRADELHVPRSTKEDVAVRVLDFVQELRVTDARPREGKRR